MPVRKLGQALSVDRLSAAYDQGYRARWYQQGETPRPCPYGDATSAERHLAERWYRGFAFADSEKRRLRKIGATSSSPPLASAS